MEMEMETATIEDLQDRLMEADVVPGPQESPEQVWHIRGHAVSDNYVKSIDIAFRSISGQKEEYSASHMFRYPNGQIVLVGSKKNRKDFLLNYRLIATVYGAPCDESNCFDRGNSTIVIIKTKRGVDRFTQKFVAGMVDSFWKKLPEMAISMVYRDPAFRGVRKTTLSSPLSENLDSFLESEIA